MNKRIAFFGSVGYNLGDEAIAVTAAEYILKNQEKTEIIISTLKKGIIEGQYNKLKEFVINRSSLNGWIRLIKFINSVDIVVIGGGTMIQDKLGISLFRGMIPYIYQITTLAKLLKKPIITLPIGIDELNTSLGRFFAKRALSKFDKLLVRDEKSMLLAHQYSQRVKRNVHLSADPAFMMGDFVSTGKNNPIFDSKTFKSGYIAISLVNENINYENYHDALINAILWILNNTTYGIVFVPMDRREEEEKEIFRNLLKEIGKINQEFISRIIIFDSKMLNLVDITIILKNAKLLIAMRLHAMILSVGYTPIIGISRTTKTETFLKEFQLPFFDVGKYIDPSKMLSTVMKILGDSNNSLNQIKTAYEIRQKKIEIIKDSLNKMLEI